jgi:hypothetical protein
MGEQKEKERKETKHTSCSEIFLKELSEEFIWDTNNALLYFLTKNSSLMDPFFASYRSEKHNFKYNSKTLFYFFRFFEPKSDFHIATADLKLANKGYQKESSKRFLIEKKLVIPINDTKKKYAVLKPLIFLLSINLQNNTKFDLLNENLIKFIENPFTKYILVCGAEKNKPSFKQLPKNGLRRRQNFPIFTIRQIIDNFRTGVINDTMAIFIIQIMFFSNNLKNMVKPKMDKKEIIQLVKKYFDKIELSDETNIAWIESKRKEFLSLLPDFINFDKVYEFLPQITKPTK